MSNRTAPIVLVSALELRPGDVIRGEDGNRWTVVGPPIRLVGSKDLVVRLARDSGDYGRPMRTGRDDQYQLLRPASSRRRS